MAKSELKFIPTCFIYNNIIELKFEYISTQLINT